MKIVVKFKGVDYRTGNKRKFKHTFNTDIEFEEIRQQNALKNIFKKDGVNKDAINLLDDEVVTTVYEQALNWVDDRDNIDIIHNYDLSCIVDYEVIRVGEDSLKKQERSEIELYGDKRIAKGGVYELPKHNIEAEKVVVLLELNVDDEQLKKDFLVVYKEIYNNVKSLGFRKQFSIVMNSTSIAYQSATNTLTRLSDYNKELNALPKYVWKCAMNQGRMTTSEYIKAYRENTLPEVLVAFLQPHKERHEHLEKLNQNKLTDGK